MADSYITRDRDGILTETSKTDRHDWRYVVTPDNLAQAIARHLSLADKAAVAAAAALRGARKAREILARHGSQCGARASDVANLLAEAARHRRAFENHTRTAKRLVRELAALTPSADRSAA